MTDSEEPRSVPGDIRNLLDIMARLRDPDGGCPWDLEQSFETIAPYTLEEAYEVEDAIAAGDLDALREELGDLLLQVVFHARMAEEQQAFDFADVVNAICEKLVRRHPHVFGDAEVASADEQTRSWEAFKRAEREGRAAAAGRAPSHFDGIPQALPALLRAQKLEHRAARLAGAGKPDAAAALAAASSSLDVAAGERPDDAHIGALLYACVQLADAVGVDPEAALRDETRRREAAYRNAEPD